MVKNVYIVISVFFMISLLVSCSSESIDTNEIMGSENQVINLEHLSTFSMKSGTHRPEIILYDSTIQMYVVNPMQSENGKNTHQNYIYDLNFNSLHSNVISFETETDGFGADHRSLYIGEYQEIDTVLTVYQSISLFEDAPLQIQGATEKYAKSQSMMLVLTRADTGEVISTKRILFSEDFNVDTFPDMSIILWSDNSFLMTTGTGINDFKMWEIGFDGDLIQENEYAFATIGIGSSIGNSLVNTESGLLLFSYGFTGEQKITVTEFDSNLQRLDTVVLDQKTGLESAFPTDVIEIDGLYFIGYISRQKGEKDMNLNPYYPSLLVIDAEFEVIYDKQVSQISTAISNAAGSSHVNANLEYDASTGVLYYAWSKAIGAMPQVQVEKFYLLRSR
jgi:hypothetical protein